MKYITLVFAIVSSSLASDLTLAVALKKCTTIEKSSERLECYDLSVKREQPKKEKAKVLDDTSGEWVISTKKTLLRGLQQFSAFTTGTKVRTDVTPVLAIRCTKNKTNLFLTFGNIYLGNKKQYLSVKLDDGEIIARSWDPSTNGLGLFYGAGAIAYIQALTKYQSMTIEAESYDRAIIQTKFDIRGVSSVARKAAKVCGW